ncbi:hypothetical protein [Flavobacterium crassostreae]|uniref:POTRA domain-containing protein n=1 Tax=Flavobacterium crassostreae TaxID=1763534 RepID=A0A1B9E2I3_9FLAO|nr:hypothetical protein [Flavobacterium crassostreae]OCB76136.1 hypothetical protein LPBF_07450 [Flavobacterium crassostreae]
MGLQNIKILFGLFFFLCYQCVFSQDKTLQKKVTPKDSTEIYKDIHHYSKKNKITTALYKLVFRPIKSHRKTPETNQPEKQNLAQGKIIRKITVVTLDPFGYSDSDSTQTHNNWYENLGNRLHLKSKKFAIKNLLLFKKNTPYNSLKIEETARILRSQKFVNRVTISEKITGPTADSVDITIRVLDSWTTQPRFAISSSTLRLGLNERSFLGTGQQFNYRLTNRFEDQKKAHQFAYTIPNIRNSFVHTALKYQVDLNGFYNKEIAMERPFYSPFAKWAGGFYLGQRFKKDSLQTVNSGSLLQNFKYSTQNFWTAKAVSIFNKNTPDNLTSRLILSARYLNIKYNQSPIAIADPLHFYGSEQQILVGIGINTRKFVKERYLFKNGIIEDVPIGRIYGITTGYQYKNNQWRPYLGAQISFGNYHPWGFLSTNLEAGSFFSNSKTEQTAFTFQAHYFTNLFTIGKWHLRQFIKPQITIGLHRKDILGDLLNINEDNGILGFYSPLYGNKKAVITLQTQTYAPREIIGFRLNPYFNYTLAALGGATTKTKAYSKLGIGILLTNDYLVFSSLQLSFSYYPKIPLEGTNIFKTNTFESTDFGLQSFELAEPKTVSYK